MLWSNGRNTDKSRVGERVHTRMLVQGFENRQSQGGQGCQRLAMLLVCSFVPISVVLGTVIEIRDRPVYTVAVPLKAWESRVIAETQSVHTYLCIRTFSCNPW